MSRVALFDLWSSIYDLPLVQRVVYRPEHDAVLAALGPLACRRILDLACGTGQLGARLVRERPGAQIVGYDFSTGMLRQAAARVPAVAALVRGDAAALPFAAATFDAVVTTEAFHWFPDQGAALREVARVLRPDGRLVLTIVTPPFRLVSDAAALGSRLLGQRLHWPSPRELRDLFKASGLAVETQRYLLRLPGALMFPPTITVARPTGATHPA